MQIITEDTISRFYEDVARLGLVTPVAVIAEATQYSKGNVSDYLNKKKKPSKNFIKRFYEEFQNSLQNVPHGTSGTSFAPPKILDAIALERLIAEKDSMLNEFRSLYADAKSDKERLFTIIEGYLKDVHSNSKTNQTYLELIVRILRSGESVLFSSLDQLLDQQPGTHAKEADKVELTAARTEQRIGKNK